MASELKNLIIFFVGLSIVGSLIAFLLNLPYSTVFTFYLFFGYFAAFGWVIISVTLIIFLIFFIIVIFISIPVTQLAIYRYEIRPNPPRKLIIKKNYTRILLCNLALAVPLYFTIVYLANPSNFLSTSFDPSSVDKAFIVALLIIPGYLLSIRILTNPVSRNTILPYLEFLRTHYRHFSSAGRLKERFISFFFSLTVSTFFIMTILLIYSVYEPDSKITMTSLFAPFIPTFDPFTISILLGSCIFAIIVLTFLGEFYLAAHEPFEGE